MTISLVACSEGGIGPEQPEISYSVTSLEPLSAASVYPLGPALAINEAGQVAGSTPGGAAFWDNGAVIDLGIGGAALDINDDGTIVGTFGSAAFEWRDGEVSIVTEPPLDVSPNFFAAAVNNLGVTVGARLTCTPGTGGTACLGSAFVARNGEVEELGTPGAPASVTRDVASVARDVNGSGIVIGNTLWARVTNSRAFAWQDGQFIFLAPEGAYSYSSANAINDGGEIAGVTSEFGAHHAVVWRDGRAIDLGTLPDLYVSHALGINDSGEVVGVSFRPEDTISARAFFWRDGRMVDLNDLVPESEWIIERATDINDRGQIVAVGRNRTTGETGALLLNPVP